LGSTSCQTSKKLPDILLAMKRAEPYVESTSLVWVWQQVESLIPFLKNKVRVTCHRDFTMRNWLFDGELYVIDFEHCRPEYWLFDLEKLWSEVWLECPHLKEAFLEGYDHTFTLEEENALRAFAAFNAVTRIAWSLEQGENEYAVVGRKLLEYLRRSES
jgi:Ser/Thr protein kinase RdoA (MazF antagonist)